MHVSLVKAGETLQVREPAFTLLMLSKHFDSCGASPVAVTVWEVAPVLGSSVVVRRPRVPGSLLPLSKVQSLAPLQMFTKHFPTPVWDEVRLLPGVTGALHCGTHETCFVEGPNKVSTRITVVTVCVLLAQINPGLEASS